MSFKQYPNSIFCAKYVRANILLVILCKLVVYLLLSLWLFLLWCVSIILFFCFSLYLFVCLFVCSFDGVCWHCYFLYFTKYLIEAVRSCGLSMIQVNLWKTYFANDWDNWDWYHLVRDFSLEMSWYFSVSLSLKSLHLAYHCSFNI